VLFAVTVVRRAVRRARASDGPAGRAFGAEGRATVAQTRAGVPVRALALDATSKLGRSARLHARALVAETSTRADVGRTRHFHGRPADQDCPEHHRESYLSHGNFVSPSIRTGNTIS
jgi:hypothetical protein